MFGWLGNLILGFGNALSGIFGSLGRQIAASIWETMMEWLYTTVFDAMADFFTMIGGMGADLFTLSWVQATVKLFTLIGWALYAAGTVVAVFDVAIEYQSGRANIKSCALHILKGFFACSLLGVLPVELYKFCISLQNTFSRDLAALFANEQTVDISAKGAQILNANFLILQDMQYTLFMLLSLLAFGYCIVKIFFANIMRGGIMLVQIAVGSLYMFGIPRGYDDGFMAWVRQVIALCLTAFLQATLLYLGLLTFQTSMLLGLGVMLAAGEVPRIAQQFGLDTSTRNGMVQSVIHTGTTAFSAIRAVVK